MNRPGPLEVVFLTNFSDSCYRAIPSVAQMVDDLAVNLTIVHAHDPKRSDREDAEACLRSFFPEADRYEGSKRIVMAGHPVDALQRLAGGRQIDLTICPSSDALGVPRIGHRPLRGRVAHECGIPVWTIGRGTDSIRLGRPAKNVACWMDFDATEIAHVQFAAEYASKVGAKLHLLHTLPEMDEGMLLPAVSGWPRHANGIEETYGKLLRRYPVKPIIHLHGGNGRKSRATLAKIHNIDVLFTSVARSPLTDWAYSDFNAVDRCPCPVVCVGEGAAHRVWDLKRGPAHAVQPRRTQPETVAEPALV